MTTRKRRPIERPGLVVHLDSIRLTEYDDDGFIGFQIDADGEQGDNPELEPRVEPFEALHPGGVIHRPLDTEVDGSGRVAEATQGLTFWEGARAYGLALHDSRIVPGLALLKPGETVLYGPAFNFVRCHSDGRVSVMCTTDGTANGETVLCEIGPAGFVLRGPWGKLSHDALGLHYLHVSGARLDLGAISGLPAPLDQLDSYANLKAQTVTIGGAAVKVGAGAFEPAAKALTLLSVLATQGAANSAQAAADTNTAAALTAIQAALSVTVPPVGAGTAAPIAAAVAALGAAVTALASATSAIAAAATTVPTQSAQVA